jgi:hypothetical protein
VVPVASYYDFKALSKPLIAYLAFGIAARS